MTTILSSYIKELMNLDFKFLNVYYIFPENSYEPVFISNL